MKRYKKSKFWFLWNDGSKKEPKEGESYFNLEKAVLQVKSTQEDVSLAKEEVVAARSKKDLNLAQISELVSAKLKLANSKKSYFEALFYYNVSRASLEKAIGQNYQVAAEEEPKPTEQEKK